MTIRSPHITFLEATTAPLSERGRGGSWVGGRRGLPSGIWCYRCTGTYCLARRLCADNAWVEGPDRTVE